MKAVYTFEMLGSSYPGCSIIFQESEILCALLQKIQKLTLVILVGKMSFQALDSQY
jgi:hypothetical protein